MGGRRHPASGGVDGLCNKNPWREARKRRLAAGKQRRQPGDWFRLTPLDSLGRFVEEFKGGKNKQRELGYTSAESSGRACTFYALFVLFSFFGRGGQTRGDNCTVSQPSGLEWKSAIFCLTTPGSGAIGKEPTVLRMCSSRCQHPRTISWTQEIFFLVFGGNWGGWGGYKTVGPPSGRGWERLTSSDGGCVSAGASDRLQKEKHIIPIKTAPRFRDAAWRLSGGP